MAKAISCDRCGVFEKLPPLSDCQPTPVTGWITLNKNFDEAVRSGSTTIFLCPRCVMDFDHFMVEPLPPLRKKEVTT